MVQVAVTPSELGNPGCAIRDQAACSMAGRSTYGCVSNEACCPCGDDEEEDCVPKYCAKTACKGGKCHPP